MYDTETMKPGPMNLEYFTSFLLAVMYSPAHPPFPPLPSFFTLLQRPPSSPTSSPVVAIRFEPRFPPSSSMNAGLLSIASWLPSPRCIDEFLPLCVLFLLWFSVLFVLISLAISEGFWLWPSSGMGSVRIGQFMLSACFELNLPAQLQCRSWDGVNVCCPISKGLRTSDFRGKKRSEVQAVHGTCRM